MSNGLVKIIAAHEDIANSEKLKSRFESILKENAASFITSVLNLVKTNEKLQECDGLTVWNAALTAATMKLPVDPNLGYAYIIPYGNKAQFQIGYKGIKVLAHRSGMYDDINADNVREGEIESRNRLTGKIKFKWIENDEEREQKPIIGYFSYFRLKDGTESTLYMTIPELKSHALKYSKAYQYDLKKGKKESKWSDEDTFGLMCMKTVTKLNISRNGIMSIEDNCLQMAIARDQAIIYDDNKIEYPDNDALESENRETTNLEKLNETLSTENADETATVTVPEYQNNFGELPEEQVHFPFADSEMG